MDRAGLQPGIEPRHETVATPDKENAIYLAAFTMPIKDEDADYPALLMGNFVLGGGALSWHIADRLRQQGGLLLHGDVDVASQPDRSAGSLMVLAIYNPANVAKVATGVEEELARLLNGGVKADELEKAKTGSSSNSKSSKPWTPCSRRRSPKTSTSAGPCSFRRILSKRSRNSHPMLSMPHPQACRPQTAFGGYRRRFWEEVGSRQ